MFKFRMGEVIKVPSDVFASGRAKLVGVEEGEQNKHLRKISVGYVYSIREESPDQQPPLAGLARMRAHDNVKYVSEEQIAAWLKG